MPNGDNEFETIAEAIGPYDTQEEALMAGEEEARRMRGTGHVVEDLYAVQREDGLWDVVIEYQVRAAAAPKEKRKTGMLILGGVLTTVGVGTMVFGMTRSSGGGYGILPKGSRCMSYSKGPTGRKICDIYRLPDGGMSARSGETMWREPGKWKRYYEQMGMRFPHTEGRRCVMQQVVHSRKLQKYVKRCKRFL